MTSIPEIPRAPGGSSGAPLGPPTLVWFAGVISGQRDGSDAPMRAADAIRAAGAGAPNLELDGGRFSILVDADPFDPRGATPDYLDVVERALRSAAAASPAPESVTSTVRCTEVFGETVRETAFLMRAGSLHRVERLRPARAEDLARRAAGDDTPPWSAAAGFGRRRLITIGVLSVLLLSILAWTGGYVDRLFAPDPTLLKRDYGPFGETLSVEAESSFGFYALKVRRGAAYPRDRASADALLAASTTPAERAANAAVVDGGEVYLRVDGDDGEALSSVKVSLRALVTREDAVVEAKVPGRIGGRRISVALESRR